MRQRGGRPPRTHGIRIGGEGGMYPPPRHGCKLRCSVRGRGVADLGPHVGHRREERAAEARSVGENHLGCDEERNVPLARDALALELEGHGAAEHLHKRLRLSPSQCFRRGGSLSCLPSSRCPAFGYLEMLQGTEASLPYPPRTLLAVPTPYPHPHHFRLQL